MLCCSVVDHTVTPLFRPVRSELGVLYYIDQTCEIRIRCAILISQVICEGSFDRQLGRCGSILYAGCVFVIIVSATSI
jgi:hypothetical protein